MLLLEDGSGFLALEICVEAPSLVPGGGGFVLFTRRRWREFMLAYEAEQRAIADIEGNRSPAQQDAIGAAVDAANKALLALNEAAETAKLNADLRRLANALDGAVNAKQVGASIRRANAAIMASHAIITEAKRQADEEDELMQVILLLQ